MLRRMAADDAEPVGSLPAYSDVTEDDWFADAVAWAFHAGIATGNADGSFAPRRTVTRTELAVMLSRFAEARGMDTTASGDLSQWTDGASVPAYAAAPMSWALERGVLGSMVTETIHGKLPVSRRQCAQIHVALTAAMENEPLAVQIAEQDVLPPIVSAAATITVGFKPRLMLPQPSMEPSAYRWRSSRVGRSRTPTPPAGPPKTWRK